MQQTEIEKNGLWLAFKCSLDQWKIFNIFLLDGHKYPETKEISDDFKKYFEVHLSLLQRGFFKLKPLVSVKFQFMLLGHHLWITPKQGLEKISELWNNFWMKFQKMVKYWFLIIQETSQPIKKHLSQTSHHSQIAPSLWTFYE